MNCVIKIRLNYDTLCLYMSMLLCILNLIALNGNDKIK